MVKLNPNRVSINDFIYSLYEEREVTTDSGETKTEYILPDEISYHSQENYAIFLIQ